MGKKNRPDMLPKTYPSPAERERIIRRRDELVESIASLFFPSSREEQQAIARLLQKYGQAEVEKVLEKLAEASRRPFVGEEAFLYREYRQAFARFGGARPFLNRREFEHLHREHTMLFLRRKMRRFFSRQLSVREKELRHLLLIGERTWSELFPPDPPPRPADFSAPPPGTYKGPLTELLRLGWEENKQQIARWSRKASLWRPLIPDLERMVLDEGLLSGWPADPASWAPLHALYMLGFLQAHSSAGPLLALLDRENDWLSDLLPDVWARMGPSAAQPLWAYLEDRSHSPISRGIVVDGLKRMAQKHPESRSEIVRGLERILREAPMEDGEANAYIVYMLGEIQARETIPTIRQAFREGKVDIRIVGPDTLEAMGMPITSAE